MSQGRGIRFRSRDRRLPRYRFFRRAGIAGRAALRTAGRRMLGESAAACSTSVGKLPVIIGEVHKERPCEKAAKGGAEWIVNALGLNRFRQQ